MSKHLLIDADLLVYRSCTTEAEATIEDCCNFFDSVLDFILWELLDFPSQDDYTLYLSGKNNFRKELYPDYKANRKGPKPPNFAEVSAYVASLPNCVVCDSYEADDGISIAAHRRGFKNVIIVSSDKDYKQLPVEIYNTYHWKRETVTKAEARLNLWTQVLTGDYVDNIKGCKGIGPKKAHNLLKGYSKEDDYKRAVWEAFMDADPINGDQDFAKAYRLVKLLSTEKELTR